MKVLKSIIMKNNIYEIVTSTLGLRINEVLEILLPNGKVIGKYYTCASIKGGHGQSCKTDISSGRGCDYATDDKWGDIIALVALQNKSSQYEAALFLADLFNIDLDEHESISGQKMTKPTGTVAERLILPISEPIPKLPVKYSKATVYSYKSLYGQLLWCVIRIDNPDGGKFYSPLTVWESSTGQRSWKNKAPPTPRHMYGLDRLGKADSAKPILLVEGEKAADASESLFPNYICMTWMGGANAVHTADWSPLENRKVIIWPDNDEAGVKVSLKIADILDENYSNKAKIVCLPEELPPKWDVADPVPVGVNIHELLSNAVFKDEFLKYYMKSHPDSNIQVDVIAESEEILDIPEWPIPDQAVFLGFAGRFVELATRDSEADPIAVLMTLFVRFGAEVYQHDEDKGAYCFVGNTKHPPCIFVVVIGDSAKARKGVSTSPVTALFDRNTCNETKLQELDLPPPAKVSGGPLSSGEGLGYQFHLMSKDKDNSDRRLFIQDEEFASALACCNRQGNTLSMAVRTFWDGKPYSPLTKNDPVEVDRAHLCILSHITQDELKSKMTSLQISNGFGNRFLWVCARRTKEVPLPRPMPQDELSSLQLELWKLVQKAQNLSEITMTPEGERRWCDIYPKLTKAYSGMFGAITARSEPQTLRLALIYALLDGKDKINENHINSAYALWQYCSDSAKYLFGGNSTDPLEEKIIAILQSGSLTATALSNALSNHIPKEKLKSILMKLEASNRITIQTERTKGRPKKIITLCERS